MEEGPIMADAASRGRWLPILPGAGGAGGAGGAASAERGAGAAGAGGEESAERAGGAAGATAEAALARRAGEALDELATALAAAMEKAPEDHPGGFSALADGPAGLALFFHYLDQARPGQGHDERALAHLEAAIEAVSEMTAAPGLYGGFAGVAWVLEHLTGRLVEPPAPGEEDPGGEVAAALAGYLRHSPWRDEYDLIGGLVGFGVWGIERAPRALGEEAVASVVRRLGELAERRDDGIAWRSPPERMLPTELAAYPQGNFNLGVAHGVPGVVGVLGEVRAAGLDDGQARELLAGAVAWLLAQRLPDGAASRFPYAVAPGVEPSPSRLAWCYGDPGIALALLVAARAAGEPEWERQALAVARAAAERPREQGGIRDGGLCHGAAGLVHLYDRLFQATGDPLFRRESLAWTGRLLDQRRPGEGIAGWSSWRPIGEVTLPTPELGWVPDPGFLTGAAGIGLALLALTSPVEPAWDRVLLSSVPPRQGPPSDPCQEAS
jgi:lantibiotic modifying enzyme